MGLLLLIIFSSMVSATEPIVQLAWEKLESQVRGLPIGETRGLFVIDTWGYPDWVYQAVEPLCLASGYTCTFTLQSDRYKVEENRDAPRAAECEKKIEEYETNQQIYEAWRKKHDNRWFFQSVDDLGPQPIVPDCGTIQYHCQSLGPRGYTPSFVVVHRLQTSSE